MSWQGLAQRELDDVGVAGVEGRLAVGQVEGPDALEAGVEAQALHRVDLAQEGLAPAAQGLGVVGPKARRCSTTKPARRASASKAEGLGSRPPGKMYCWMKSVERT
jgi:hypothetical protein